MGFSTLSVCMLLDRHDGKKVSDIRVSWLFFLFFFLFFLAIELAKSGGRGRLGSLLLWLDSRAVKSHMRVSVDTPHSSLSVYVAWIFPVFPLGFFSFAGGLS